MKVCRVCLLEKESSYFYEKKSICKTCQNAKDKEYYRKNRETKISKKKVYNQSNVDKIKKYQKHYRDKTTEKRLKYANNWRKENKDRLKKMNSSWQKRNPAKVVALSQRHRSLKMNAQGSYTAKEWLELVELHDGKCVACGVKGKLTVDHVVPLSKGGTNFIDNLQPLCSKCNSSKGTKTIDYRGLQND